MGLKQWAFGRAVKASKDNAVGALKTAWSVADGWKTWIVAIVAVYKLACVDCATNGYIDAGIKALGWNNETGAFDAKEALSAFLVILALGHKVLKAYHENKAGIPLAEVGRSQLDQSVAVIHPEPGAPPVVVTKAELSLARAQPTAKVVVLEPKPGD